MDQLTVYLVALGFGVALAVGVCLLMRRTLESLLTELCGTTSRARFWLIFGDVGLVLATLWCGLWFAPTGGDASYEALRVFVRTLSGTTFGLLAVLVLLGFVLLLSIARAERANRRPLRHAAPLAQPE